MRFVFSRSTDRVSLHGGIHRLQYIHNRVIMAVKEVGTSHVEFGDGSHRLVNQRNNRESFVRPADLGGTVGSITGKVAHVILHLVRDDGVDNADTLGLVDDGNVLVADAGHGLTATIVVLDEALVLILAFVLKVGDGGQVGGITHFIVHAKCLRHILLYLITVDVGFQLVVAVHAVHTVISQRQRLVH